MIYIYQIAIELTSVSLAHARPKYILWKVELEYVDDHVVLYRQVHNPVNNHGLYIVHSSI